MLFKASLVALALALPSALGLAIARDTIDPQTCVEEQKYIAYFSPFPCLDLSNTCLTTLKDNSTDLWSVPTCVAAITCDGTNLLTLAQCHNPAVSKANAPHLNYNIYAGIVGDCAWAAGGCPITFQNYVDFVYGQISAIGSTSWPSSVSEVQVAWDAITTWTATGETVPYTNFDDWLHYGPMNWDPTP